MSRRPTFPSELKRRIRTQEIDIFFLSSKSPFWRSRSLCRPDLIQTWCPAPHNSSSSSSTSYPKRHRVTSPTLPATRQLPSTNRSDTRARPLIGDFVAAATIAQSFASIALLITSSIRHDAIVRYFDESSCATTRLQEQDTDESTTSCTTKNIRYGSFRTYCKLGHIVAFPALPAQDACGCTSWQLIFL